MIDSLRKAFTNAKNDTLKVRILFDLANYFVNEYPDTTLIYAEKIQTIANRINYEKGKMWGLSLAGIGNYMKGNKTIALQYFQTHLAVAEKSNNLAYKQRAYALLGNFYAGEHNPAVALTYYQQALQIAEQMADKELIVMLLGNIGIMYATQNDYKKSLAYHEKSLPIYQELGSKYQISLCLKNIATAHDRNGNYQKAVVSYHKSLQYEAILSPIAIANIKANLGFAYMKQTKYDSASVYFQIALNIYEANQEERNIVYNYDGLAKLHIRQKDYPKAVEYAQKGWALAQKNKNLSQIKEISETLALAYKGNGEYGKALEYYEIFKQTQDSLFTVDKSKAIANLETKDELRRKQQEFSLLEKDKNLQIEREKNAKLALEKQAEADRLRNEARQEKDKHKQDSLYRLAQTTQLEADKFSAESKRLQAENETQQLKAQKEKEAKELQQRILYITLAGLAVALILAYLAYRSRQAEKRAKNEINIQKEEITAQAEQLDIANKTKDQLFSIIAHDLRSPMMSFQGINKQIRFFLSKNRPEKLEELGENIEKSSTRLNALLDNLLQWAMLQKQVIKVNPQSIDLQEATTHCLSYYEGLAQSQQVTLHQQVGKEFITTDYNILQTILRNLISNALKFTSEGDSIYLAYQREGRQGTLSVRDTGAGMSAEKVATLFQGIQFKSEQGLRGEKGTGIGLQLCYELAQQINATLSVQSEEGQGSIFSLVLDDIQARQ